MKTSFRSDSIVLPPPEHSPRPTAHMNDVYVDEHRVIYAIERFTGGLYILELDTERANQ